MTIKTMQSARGLQAVSLLIVVMVSSACAGSGPELPPTEAGAPSSPGEVPVADPDTAQDALRAAVQAYSDAYLSGDSEGAWDLLSRRCRARITRPEFEAIVTGAAEIYEPEPVIEFDAHISGDLARVSYSFAEYPDLAQDSEPWTIEGGEWREDDC